MKTTLTHEKLTQKRVRLEKIEIVDKARNFNVKDTVVV